MPAADSLPPPAPPDATLPTHPPAAEGGAWPLAPSDAASPAHHPTRAGGEWPPAPPNAARAAHPPAAGGGGWPPAPPPDTASAAHPPAAGGGGWPLPPAGGLHPTLAVQMPANVAPVWRGPGAVPLGWGMFGDETVSSGAASWGGAEQGVTGFGSSTAWPILGPGMPVSGNRNKHMPVIVRGARSPL